MTLVDSGVSYIKKNSHLVWASSVSRTSIRMRPSQFSPCQRALCWARWSSFASPIPHRASWGDASAKVCPAVSINCCQRWGFWENCFNRVKTHYMRIQSNVLSTYTNKPLYITTLHFTAQAY